MERSPTKRQMCQRGHEHKHTQMTEQHQLMGTCFSQQMTGKFRIRWKSCRGTAALGEAVIQLDSLNLAAEGLQPLSLHRQQVLGNLAFLRSPSLPVSFLFTLFGSHVYPGSVSRALQTQWVSLSPETKLKKESPDLTKSQLSGKPTAPTASPGANWKGVCLKQQVGRGRGLAEVTCDSPPQVCCW